MVFNSGVGRKENDLEQFIVTDNVGNNEEDIFAQSLKDFEYIESEFEKLFKINPIPHSIHDIQGENELALTFTSKHSVELYRAFERSYAEEIIENKHSLRIGVKLFESLEKAKINLGSHDVKEMVVLKFDVDLSKCLDLLNMGHIAFMQKFYMVGMEEKWFDPKALKRNADAEVINKLHQYNKKNSKTNFSLVRRFISGGKPIYRNSSLKEVTYIEYIILDTECIKSISRA